MSLEARTKLKYFLGVAGSFTIGYSTLILLMPLYLAQLGASQTEIGFLQAAYTIPSFFVPVLAGKLSDKYGRPPVILVALVGFTLFVPLFPMAQDILQVILIRIAQGIFAAIWWVSIDAQIADLATSSQRSRVIGLYNASWGTGFLIGPFLAGYIIENYGFKLTFYFAAIVMASLIPLILVGAQMTIPHKSSEPHHIVESAYEPFPNIPSLIPSWVTAGVCGGILGLVLGLYPVYAETLQVPIFQIGILLLIYGVARIVTFLGASIFMNRLGDRTVMFGGLSLLLPILLLGLSTKTTLHGVVLGLIGIGLGLAYTSALVIASRVPPNVRGMALGKFEMAFSLGLAGMAQTGGIFADYLGLHTPYLLGGVFTAITLLSLFIIYQIKPIKAKH
ncbi:MAG: MFS transporter [Candidatus Heimdallarchaeota archaeon]